MAEEGAACALGIASSAPPGLWEGGELPPGTESCPSVCDGEA